MSVMEYDKGKIVFMGDYGLFVNGWLDESGGEQLGLNIVNWLAKRESGTYG